MRMPFLVISLLAAGAAAWLVSGPTAVPAHAHESTVNWHKDLEAARAEARRNGKPLYVVFRCVP